MSLQIQDFSRPPKKWLYGPRSTSKEFTTRVESDILPRGYTLERCTEPKKSRTLWPKTFTHTSLSRVSCSIFDLSKKTGSESSVDLSEIDTRELTFTQKFNRVDVHFPLTWRGVITSPFWCTVSLYTLSPIIIVLETFCVGQGRTGDGCWA